MLDVILERVPATMLLMGTALSLSLVLGLGVGILGAVRRGSVFDYLATSGAMLALSFPTFWFGLMAIFVFAIKLGWLPSGGMYELGEEGDPFDLLRHLILPASVLALVLTASWSRYARSSFLEVLGQDYMRTARAKGLLWRAQLFRHAFPNAVKPLIALARRRAADALLRRAGRRDDLRLARHGAPVRGRARHEGVPHPHGDADVHLRRRDPGQPPGRHRDRADRPAGEAAVTTESLTLEAEEAGSGRFESQGRRVLRRFLRHRLAVLGAALVVTLCASALFAPALAPHDPLAIDTNARFLAPAERSAFLLGTDELGRDTLSRLLYGGRVSLTIGIVAMVTTVLTGAFIGTLAGYRGGWVDTLLMRFVDTMLCFPQIFLLLVVAAFVPPTLLSIALIIGLTSLDGGGADRARARYCT